MKYNFHFHFSDIAMAFKSNWGHWGENERERGGEREREKVIERYILLQTERALETYCPSKVVMWGSLIDWQMATWSRSTIVNWKLKCTKFRFTTVQFKWGSGLRKCTNRSWYKIIQRKTLESDKLPSLNCLCSEWSNRPCFNSHCTNTNPMWGKSALSWWSRQC